MLLPRGAKIGSTGTGSVRGGVDGGDEVFVAMAFSVEERGGEEARVDDGSDARHAVPPLVCAGVCDMGGMGVCVAGMAWVAGVPVVEEAEADEEEVRGMHTSLCVGQCERWHSGEQYVAALQEPQALNVARLMLASVFLH